MSRQLLWHTLYSLFQSVALPTFDKIELIVFKNILIVTKEYKNIFL